MKTLATILFVGLVSTGCALAPKFDANESLLFAEIATHSKLLKDEECSSSEKVVKRLEQMKWASNVLDTYAGAAPKQEDIAKAITILVNDVKEFEMAYKVEKPTLAYCKFKAQAIYIKSYKMLETVHILEK